jgi:hypothetical protein
MREILSRSMFATEASMLPALIETVVPRWRQHPGPWVLLTEQQTESRIPDLVLARVDVDAISERLSAELERPLTRTELLAVQFAKPDRPASSNLLARRMMVTERHAKRLLRRLAADGFLSATASGSFRRNPALRRIITRLVTFELKREDWRGALVQAATHRQFAHVAYVVCDQRFCRRFATNASSYRGSGVGVLSLDGETRQLRSIVPARANRNIDRLAFNVAGEEIWKMLRRLPVRRLRQTTLPNVAAPIVDRAPRLLAAPHSRTRARSRGAGERLLRGLAPA